MGMVRDFGQSFKWMPGKVGILLQYEADRVFESAVVL